VRVKLLFFATLRDRAGVKSLELEIPEGMTVRELKDKISAEYPNLKPSMETVLVSVNKDYAFDETVLPAGAEVAMFPPVSGGNGEFQFVNCVS
jgi:molybdopterin synthase catalytic subunit